VRSGFIWVGLCVFTCSPAAGYAQAADWSLVGPAFGAIQVADVEAASAWYQRVLALEELNRMDAADGRFSIRMLSRGDVSLELIQERGVERAAGRQLGLFKMGLFVTDIDAAHRDLAGLEVDQDSRIFLDEVLHVRSFVFRDQDGNRIQLFQKCHDGCQLPSDATRPG